MKHVLFSFHLHQTVLSRRVKPVDIASKLGYRFPSFVKQWLEGETVPALMQLPHLAAILEADPVEMVAVWIADQCPRLEPILWAEVLVPRGSDAPRLDDPLIVPPRMAVKMT